MKDEGLLSGLRIPFVLNVMEVARNIFLPSAFETRPTPITWQLNLMPLRLPYLKDLYSAGSILLVAAAY